MATFSIYIYIYIYIYNEGDAKFSRTFKKGAGHKVLRQVDFYDGT